MFKTRKVVIVGAGHVGSHVALALIRYRPDRYPERKSYRSGAGPG